jgi:hypothetical protein
MIDYLGYFEIDDAGRNIGGLAGEGGPGLSGSYLA